MIKTNDGMTNYPRKITLVDELFVLTKQNISSYPDEYRLSLVIQFISFDRQ